MRKKQNGLENLEFEEIKKYIKDDIRITRIILIIFIALAFFFIFYLKVSIFLQAPIILVIWFLIYFIYGAYIEKQEDIAKIYKLYFAFLFLDILFITIIIHFIGGTEWIGGIFYLLILSLPFVVFSKEKNRILALSVMVFYSTLIILEFYEIIPHHTIFEAQKYWHLYQNPPYIIATTAVLFFFIFFSLEMTTSFAETLKRTSSELFKARQKIQKALNEVEEAKNILEVRVRARTKELEELTKGLEGQVKERTQELQKKVNELEKINKLMVGRELKMAELKKELKNLKKELPET